MATICKEKVKYKAPFPYFGSKSRIAPVVWQAFGDVQNYIEPFFGSGAVLLNRPQPFDGVETVNDADGMIANFWRAVQHDPAKVAHYADAPVFENDLNAKHFWLVERKDSLQTKLEGDPDFYDAKVAGFWCWGMCCWIGGRFCSGDGSWSVVEKDGVRQLVNLRDAGRGVKRQRVHLGAGMGVNRKIVHLGNAGRGKAGLGEQGIYAWMEALAQRLRRVRVCCGDWRRVCGGKSGDALTYFFASGNRAAIFLDPPYSRVANRDAHIYCKDDLDVAVAVRDWAITHGNDKRLRIVLCGYEGEHNMPRTWRCIPWKAQGGYASLANGHTNGKANCHRERLWLSPHCLPITTGAKLAA